MVGGRVGVRPAPLIGVSPHHPNTTTSFSQPSTAFPQTPPVIPGLGGGGRHNRLLAFPQTLPVIPTNPPRHSHKPSRHSHKPSRHSHKPSRHSHKPLTSFPQTLPGHSHKLLTSFPRRRESSGLRPIGIQRNTCAEIHQTEPSWCSRSHEQGRSQAESFLRYLPRRSDDDEGNIWHRQAGDSALGRLTRDREIMLKGWEARRVCAVGLSLVGGMVADTTGHGAAAS